MKAIHKKEISSAIKYFEGFDVANDMAIGAFFVLKGAGLTHFKKHPYESWKDLIPKSIWQVGSIYDSSENGKICCFLFPFSISDEIKKSHFYNPSTALNNIASRFRDTIDNSLLDYYVEKFGNRKDGSEYYKFKNSYLKEAAQLLKNQKIELKYFLSWCYKFLIIEEPVNELFDEDAYILLRNKFMLDFNLQEEELNTLFSQNERSIKLGNVSIEGDELRNLLSFAADVKIEFDKPQNPEFYKNLNFLQAIQIPKIITFMNENPSIDYYLQSLAMKGQLIIYGPPGTSKTYIAKKQIGKNFKKIFEIQFHPNTSYQEFIGGMQVQEDGTFKPKNGVLLDAILYAKKTDHDVLLIIDEINRGNITAILGESIQALDREYTTSLVNYSCPELKNEIAIPKKLTIVGTMNSSDRSISIEDKAILRRFHKIRVFPDYTLLEKVTEYKNLDGFNPINFLKKLNENLLTELNDIDLQIGHAYLMPSSIYANDKFVWTKDAFLHVYNDSIVPLLEEYTIGSKESLNKILGGTDFTQRIYSFDALKENVLNKITA